jgi:putative transposase
MMRPPNNTPLQLAEGSKILLNGKVGEVYRSSPLGCELVWEEWIDLETNEVISPVSDKLTKEQLDRSVSRGQLKILDLPEHLFIQPPEKAAAIAPRPAELKRAAWRDCYITAAQSLIDGDVLKPYRADFVRNFSEIVLRGLQEDRCRSEGRMKSRRAGQPLEIRMPPRCGEPVWEWWKANSSVDRGGSFDNYRASGRRDCRFTDEERELMQQLVDLRLTEERPSIASILVSVQARFRTNNRNALKSDTAAAQMKIPGYDTVWALIAQMAQIDHKVRTRGMDARDGRRYIVIFTRLVRAESRARTAAC